MDAGLNAFLTRLLGIDMVDYEYVVEILRKLDLYEHDLADIVIDFCNKHNIGWGNLDIMFIVFDYLKNRAIWKLNQIDRLRKLEPRLNIWVSSNSKCTMFDWGGNFLARFEDELEKLKVKEKKFLRDDKYVVWFLYELGLDKHIRLSKGDVIHCLNCSGICLYSEGKRNEVKCIRCGSRYPTKK